MAPENKLVCENSVCAAATGHAALHGLREGRRRRVGGGVAAFNQRTSHRIRVLPPTTSAIFLSLTSLAGWSGQKEILRVDNIAAISEFTN